MSAASREPRQYGNMRRPTTAGLVSNLTRGQSIALLGQGVVALLLFIFSGSLLVGLAVLTYMAVAVSLIYFKDSHQTTYMTRISERNSTMLARILKTNRYRAALSGSPTLPPPLSATRVTEHEDGFGRSFGLVHYPEAGQVAVTLVCHPIGGGLHDRDTRDGMVAAWGGFGAMFSSQSGVSQYTATVEVGPNDGSTAQIAVEDFIDDDAPEFAKAVTRETTAMGTQRRTETKTRVTVTFEVERNRNKARAGSDDDIAADIAGRLPGIIEQLKFAGAGAVYPATAQDLARTVRIAYDPRIASVMTNAHNTPQDLHLDWSDAGPQAWDAHHDSMEHDGAVSVTWKMSVGPTGTFTDNALDSLLAPHPAIHRKRVTLVRHVIDSGSAENMVNSGYNNASQKANADRSTGADQAEFEIAQAVRREVSTGAALEYFTVIVTATVLDPEDVPNAVYAVESQMSPRARIRTRPMYAAQAVGFATGLGIGFDLKAHSTKNLIKKAVS